jgi:hypothetical protein
MNEAAEQLADSLLYEGYALYPYTPGTTKNATPTPFGIAYPPAYAAAQRAAFDHVRVEVVVLPAAAGGTAEIEAAAVFLLSEGPDNRARPRRIGVTRTPLEELIACPGVAEFAFGGVGGVSGRIELSASPAEGGSTRVRATVANSTPLAPSEAQGMDRAAALRRSLLSCQTLLGLRGARFVSPLEDEGEVGRAVQGCENVNTWPVLASPDDDAVLGAAILLPDHPAIAAESRVNTFDNTEIEEALLLHVRTLSDAEREAIEEQDDPIVRSMIDRAGSTTAEEMLALHGMMRKDAPAGAGAEVRGERELTVGDRSFRLDGKVVLRPGSGGDPYDGMMDGRTATIRRIYIDYDGRPHLGVTIDDDPMAEVLDESGRYLFFFPDEVEEANG